MPEDYVTKSEFAVGLAELKAELKTDIYEATEKVETSLLRAFERWAVPMNARTRSFEVVAAGLTERVTLLEEQMRDLDSRTGGHSI
jgi:hypothetical protein